MTDTSSRPRQFVAREPGCTGSERIAMTEITSMVPATGCLEAAWTGVRVNGTANHITAHFPVFGLHGDGRTLAIELHGRPATSADLESWLIRSGEQGRFYPGSWSEGRLWWWHPACECKGETVKREHWDPRDAELARDCWAESKAGYEAARQQAGAR